MGLHCTALILLVLGLVGGVDSRVHSYSTKTSEHFIKAIGDLHLRKVFPSANFISHAIDHVKAARPIALGVEYAAETLHYVGCVEYNDVPRAKSHLVSLNIVHHVSYISARDDILCMYLFPSVSALTDLESTDQIQFTVLEPVPELVKLDDSVHQLQYDYLHLLNNVEPGTMEAHPMMTSVKAGEKVTLSVMLRPNTPEGVQAAMMSRWLQQVDSSSSTDKHEQAQGSSPFASHVFWTSAEHSSKNRKSQHHDESSVSGDLNITAKFKFSGERRRSAVLKNRGSSPFPHSDLRAAGNRDSNTKVGRRFRELNTQDQTLFDFRHSAWKKWEATLNEIQTAGRFAEVCGHRSIEVRHHRDNIIMSLPNELLGRPDAASTASSNSPEDSNNSQSAHDGHAVQIGDKIFTRKETAGACMAHLIAAISADALVTRVALSRPMQTMNNLARQVTQLGTLGSEPYSTLKLDGTGVVIGISDTGIDETSCYFRDKVHGAVPRSSLKNPITDLKYRKVVQYITYSGSSGDYYSGHGSHVAGTVAGHCEGEKDNVTPNVYHGMAPGAKIAFFDIGVNDAGQELSIPDDMSSSIFSTAKKAGAHIHSNSWGGGYVYDSFTLSTDEFLYKNNDFLAIFAAGNSGGSGSYTVCSPALSKNCLAVACSNTGHSNANIDHISSFSSHGPALDGRIKPDITAPGSPLFSTLARSEGSTGTSCQTTQKSGTSMATPVVAGTAGLMMQYFQDKNYWAKYCDPQYTLCSGGAFTPSGSLLKALLLHSGKALKGYDGNANLALADPPDVYQGYGRVDLQSILLTVDHTAAPFVLFMDEGSLTELTEKTYAVKVSSSAAHLKVTLSWFDPPNEVFAAKYLLHDLDLVVEDSHGRQFYGNALAVDGAPALGSHRDEMNNNEQVYISSPTVTTWTVRVQAKRLTEATLQKFSLVITAKGTVRPTAGVQQLSPALLEECHLTSGTPSTTPRMELEVAKIAKLSKTGWSTHDYYAIQSTDGADFYTYGKSRSHALEVEEVCIPGGCYSATLNITSAASKKGAQVSIPECGVYLSPMSPLQSFCVDPAASYRTATEEIPVFSNDPCVSECEAEDHLLLPLYLGEYYEGAGWSGTYYSIQRLRGATSPPGLVNSFEVNSAGSGTMDWGFEQVKDHCLPLTDACYALQFSIPASLITNDMEYPVMYFLDTVLASAPHVDCPFELNSTVTLAKFCVTTGKTHGADATTTVSFYQQTDAPLDLGQAKTSWADFNRQISAAHIRVLGSCTGKATYTARAKTVNIYDLGTAAPTVLPTANPTVPPTASPSDAPSKVPTDAPTRTPSASPTILPTNKPSTTPTAPPSTAPTVIRSAPPSPMPTVMPTVAPVVVATQPPSRAPSIHPTELPSADPTLSPTVMPSVGPTAQAHAFIANFTDPTVRPSAAPTLMVTEVPTLASTAATNEGLADAVPSAVPSAIPSAVPSAIPSVVPTVLPSAVPSVIPSAIPSASESAAIPTALPTDGFNGLPTATPTTVPSAVPSAIPSAAPSVFPYPVPTVAPSDAKSANPTQEVSSAPTIAPTSVSPIPLPTAAPSAFPTIGASRAPTVAGTESLDDEARAVYGDHSLGCLSDCPGYPGLRAMVDDHDTACMFLVDVYHLCSSYSVAYGMCSVPACAADCTMEEWCYFGGGTVVSCPFMLWQGLGLDAMAIADQCVASINATAMGLDDDDAGTNSIPGSPTGGLSPNEVAAIISVVVIVAVVAAVAVLYYIFVHSKRGSGSDFPADSSHSETGEALYSTTNSLHAGSGFSSLEDGDGAAVRGATSTSSGLSPTRLAGDKVRSLLAQSASFLRDRTTRRKVAPGPAGSGTGRGGKANVGNRKEYEMVRSPFSIVGEEDDEEEVLGSGDEGAFQDSDGDRAYDSAQVDIRV